MTVGQVRDLPSTLGRRPDSVPTDADSNDGGDFTFVGGEPVAEHDRTLLRRRHFLGVLATGGVALAASGPETADAADTTEVREIRQDKRRARYHVTADIQAYYRVNRYPAARS